ncbi:hypothetical protein OTU49_011874 [Cherax quadricarinatus]|uniref:Cuticle protein 6 n=1 Tax=Cherax quadricarinatus TaxID=27406 RepID=A0AAW0W1Y7_CHEQU|nr:uncharacterized protein LOC128704870 [Cherax quadricarinatus]
MKALVLLLSVSCVCWCKPTTVVSFSPVGYSPGVAPGFAYAFRAPAPLSPLYSHTGSASGRSLLSGALSNHIDPLVRVPTVLKTQYHSQDELGQYAYGYVGDASTAHEVRTLDGAVRGSYTYVDSDGELQTASYVADRNGFRVKASNLPQAPLAPPPAAVSLPEPVKPTPEVLAATAAHLRAFAEVKASRIKRAATVTTQPPSAKVTTVKHTDNIKVDPVHVPASVNNTDNIKVNSDHVPASVNNTDNVKMDPVHVPASANANASNNTKLSDYAKANVEVEESIIQMPFPASLPVAPAFPVPLTEAAPSYVPPQFHALEELGEYKYGYDGGPSRKHEVHIPGGVTRGSYSYIDSDGEVQTVSYIADDDLGFRVLGNSLDEDLDDSYL